MGYYTHFKLEVDPRPEVAFIDAMLMAKESCEKAGIPIPQDVINFFAKPQNAFYREATREQDEDSDLLYALGGDLSGGDSVKWYEHEADMRELSSKYPELLLTLSGEGEESGDVWKKYFKGGKCQVAKAKIEIDAFDPKKLK